MADYNMSADKKGLPMPVPGNVVPPPYSHAPPVAGVGYPTAPSAMYHGYPSAPGYPGAGVYQHPQGPPPPYAVAVSQPGGSYPGHAPMSQHQQGYPMYSQPAMGPPGSTILVQGGFDAGARFDSTARPNVPPPPPGVMPNAAQMAMAQGRGVAVSQQKGSFMSGGGADAGYTVW